MVIFTKNNPLLRSTFFLLFLFSTVVYGQNDQLARNYLQQGAYEKAAATYATLLERQPSNTSYILGAVEAYQQLEAYDKAGDLLANKLNNSGNLPNLLVELGYNYQLQQQSKQADSLYEEAILQVKQNASYAYMVGRSFEKYTLLDQAIQTYKTAMEGDGKMLFEIQLARLYGEQGDVALMLNTYVDLIDRDEKFYASAQRNFSQFITEDPDNEANQTFRKLLIKRSQQEPKLLYNRLLSWLFVQQKDYAKAFAQERAIFKRSGGDIQGVFNLAAITLEEDAPEISKNILNFIIDESTDTRLKLSAQQKLLEVKVDYAKPEDYEEIAEEYRELIEVYGKTQQTVELQVAFAHFMGFQQERKEDAIAYLRETLALPLSTFQEARAKMELADLLVLQEKFGSALIYYTQIHKSLENDVIAQEARFKVAKTSYYKGDFEWAQTQLKVLKSSASQLIANDAQELYLLIADNTQEDSTHAALKVYAHADLLSFQNKTEQAITTYDSLLVNFKGDAVEDEALLAQAKLYEKQDMFVEAEQNYLNILNYYKYDILADKAYYRLGLLYENHLDNPAKAQENYEQIIFNHADSIFYIDAQRRYRALRGDILN